MKTKRSWNDEHLIRLCEIWQDLTAWERKKIMLKSCLAVIPKLQRPIVFAIRSTFAIFALLLILPFHPMSIPTAIGGGLAFALITF